MGLLVFYDGECGLCHRAVRWILVHDQKRRFLFAPLQGTTAKAYFAKPPPLDTLVLIEGYGTSQSREVRYGKGALRIAWHLGGAWKAIGWLSFFPGIIANPLYRLAARHRHRYFGGISSNRLQDLAEGSADRFLP